MAMTNAFSQSDMNNLSERDRTLVERRARILGPAYRLFYQNPVNIVRGEGVFLEDADGKRYLDAYNNVASVGHCHPAVVEAITRQTAVLNTHTRYIYEPLLDYAEDLISTFPVHLGQIMLTCTGSEANDLAFRLAKSVTGGTGVIVTDLAYHGLTNAVSEFSPSLGAFVDLGAHVRTVPAPDAYRTSSASLGETFKADVERAIAGMKRHGIKPAMLIVDAIFSSDGIFAEPAGFLKGAVDAIHAAGGLFVADEVQPGFGRTGDSMWGFERHGILPDLVTLGKPMGNGYPVAGLVARPEIIADFGEKARYFNTFGGNPVAVAAGHAVLKVIRDERLIDNAKNTGALIRKGIAEIATRRASIGDVRGAGLFIGIEIVSDREKKTPDGAMTTRIVNELRHRGVLISSAGPKANVLKIRPPLPFGPAHAGQLLTILDETIGALEAR
ncbi:aspartate aminotransferase family protein [Shinella sp. S4-D37]|uniref:aspartate aminotransferase family protein n=1 Tax=Shinella sp. S4-D37 TaxID=3161999 RepID=UPI003465916B